MPSARKKLCSCDVYKCCEERSIDEDTHDELVGIFVTPYEFKKHQTAQQEWLDNKAKQDEAIENINRRIMATTLESRELTDGSVTKQTKPPRGDAGLSQPPSRPTPTVTERKNTVTVPDAPIPPSATSHSTMDKIQRYRHNFLQLQKQFSTAKLNFTFHSPPTSADQPLADLPYTSRNGSSNKFFLDHQEKARMLIDDLDRIDIADVDASAEKDKVRVARKEIIRVIQDHLAIVDGLPEKHWVMKKVECGLLDRSKGSTVLDCCR